jgi:hypothetical protein
MDKREDTGNYYPGGTVVTGTPVPEPGGGSSVDVVAPSADGKGKAADAKAVYEGLERKLNKSDVVNPTEEAQKGQAADAKAVHGALEEKRGKTDLTVYVGDKNKPMLPPDALPVTWVAETGHSIEFSDGEYVLRTGVNGFHIADFYLDGTLRSVDPNTRFGGKPGVDGQWPKLIFGGAIPTSDKVLTSADVVAPSPDGAGNAADAKAVYEGLEGKLGKSDVVPMSSGHAGQAADADDAYRQFKEVREELSSVSNTAIGAFGKADDAHNLASNAIPKYTYVNHNLIGEPNDVLNLTPYARTNVVMAGGDTFTVLGVLGGNSEFLRDLQMVVDCRNGFAPTITWNRVFHPRTDAETDFKCEAGKRNVYWITEYAEGEFVVAGWQETDGGGTSNGGAA